jgi:tripartite-type tricarboxylate transporter receptor subunit TctC
VLRGWQCTCPQAETSGASANQSIGVFVPAGTPAAIVERLNGEIGKALADPAVRQHFRFVSRIYG